MTFVTLLRSKLRYICGVDDIDRVFRLSRLGQRVPDSDLGKIRGSLLYLLDTLGAVGCLFLAVSIDFLELSYYFLASSSSLRSHSQHLVLDMVE